MSAASACRGSTPTGGSGGEFNMVMVKNSVDEKSCTQICGETMYNTCDAVVAIYGRERKGTKNGEIVGSFYNYDCNFNQKEYGGNEATSADKDVMSYSHYVFSFCCCRKTKA